MSSAGSLIQLHHHSNIDVLDDISDSDGKLYYKGTPIYTQVSKTDGNAIQTLSDGIYVDSTYFLTEDQYNLLTKFSFVNNELLYDGEIVSREYKNSAVVNCVNAVWEAIEQEESGEPVSIDDFLDDEDDSGGDSDDAE